MDMVKFEHLKIFFKVKSNLRFTLNTFKTDFRTEYAHETNKIL